MAEPGGTSGATTLECDVRFACVADEIPHCGCQFRSGGPLAAAWTRRYLRASGVLRWASRGRTACQPRTVTSLESSPTPAAPTKVRFLTLALCIAMSMLLYLDRYALSSLTNTLQLELHLDEEQLGRTFFAFFFAYGLCQIPAGWLSDAFRGAADAGRLCRRLVASDDLYGPGQRTLGDHPRAVCVGRVAGRSLSHGGQRHQTLVSVPHAGPGEQQCFDGRTRGRLDRLCHHRGADVPYRTLARLGEGRLAGGLCALRIARPGLGHRVRLALSRFAANSSLVQCRRGRTDLARRLNGTGDTFAAHCRPGRSCSARKRC